jgi:hypothetical protein
MTSKTPQNISTLHAVLENKFDNLQAYMEKEFGEMKARQDKTNGNVTRNSSNIEILQRKWAMLAGGWIVLCIVVFPLMIKVFGNIHQ